jgi:hypothetical protein
MTLPYLTLGEAFIPCTVVLVMWDCPGLVDTENAFA